MVNSQILEDACVIDAFPEKPTPLEYSTNADEISILSVIFTEKRKSSPVVEEVSERSSLKLGRSLSIIDMSYRDVDP